MALAHPQLTGFTCEDCRAWLIDLKTGKRIERGGEPQRRRPGAPTPCRTCPRESPERGKALALGRREMATIHFYLQVRATAGVCLTERERADPLLLRNLAIVDGVFRQYERGQSAVEFANVLAHFRQAPTVAGGRARPRGRR